MRKNIIKGLLFAFVIAGVLSPFASAAPDGLERVAENLGFIHLFKKEAVINAPMRGYLIPGIPNQTLSGAVAGIVGVLLTFGLVFGIGKLLKNVDDRR